VHQIPHITGIRIAPILLLICSAWLLSPDRNAQADEAGNLIHHELEAKVNPRERRIDVRDRITLPEGFPREFTFHLHAGLNPLSDTEGVTILKEKGQGHPIAQSYRVTLPMEVKTFAVGYSGTIHHPPELYGKEQARGFSQTPGIISEEGVFLAGSSFWYPVIAGEFITFSLKAELPAEWDSVSQGSRTLHQKDKNGTVVRWESPEPQDEAYMVAARFAEYSKSSNRIQAMAFLRSPDRELAGKYLDATIKYISMYEKLIGPYPYPKFALVENFRETGFGMPSFTLLGPKIIRFPFIITSSYPHEILHSWWGNSVFPDYRTGNWSEGLTAYLSDHLLKEQEGSGTEYRQTTLQKYADYVIGGRDFPLAEFRSRHSSSSEAVGYGKSLMFFHMLRLELGDRLFVKGLKDFYEKNVFRTSSFGDLRRSFESVSGRYLGREFRQWVEQPGAPQLRLRGAEAVEDENGYLLSAMIEQAQHGDSYLLRIPVAVTMEGRGKAYQTVVETDKKDFELRLHLPARPLRIDLDPEFDLFRRLDRREIPPALSLAFGAKKMLILLPSAAGKTLLKEYREFAGKLSSSGPDEVEVKPDKEVKELPADRAVVLLGWENLFARNVTMGLGQYGFSPEEKSVRIGETEIPMEKHSVVLVTGNPHNRNMALVLIASDRGEALPGLARKLPHYHKYSYLAFEGDEPANTVKGRWPVMDSPMTFFLHGKEGIPEAGMGNLERREPLISLPAEFSGEAMSEVIRFLSSSELKGRGIGTRELDLAAEFIAEKFREAGLVPGGDTEGSYFQTWEDHFGTEGNGSTRKVLLKNVVGVIPGSRLELSDRSVVLGAHYDHLGYGGLDAREGNSGKIHPGADDNSSGVAVLIETARVLNRTHPETSIVFVAFTGEETGKKGSKHYVAGGERYPAEKCLAMVNLDTVGRLGKKKLLIIGASSAREWEEIFRGASLVTGVDIELVSGRLDSSDQRSFEEAGIPAVQLFAGPHRDYHRPGDTADKIDLAGLVKVASVAREVVEYLAGRNEPLTPAAAFAGSGEQKERKVGLGIIPDFAFGGEGCRLSSVLPDSPAEACGLREGDVIIGIDSAAVKGLKDLSDILKSLTPGSRISITFLRDGKETTAEAEVREK
jgi:aminopeptidase N